MSLASLKAWFLITNISVLQFWLNLTNLSFSELWLSWAELVFFQGVHGQPDGSLVLSPDAKDFYEEDLHQIEWLTNHNHENCGRAADEKRCKRRDAIKALNIRFTALNLQELKTKDGRVDRQLLGKKLWQLDASVLILSYCFSQQSELKQDLVAQGISSALVIKNDYWHIRGKR